MSEQKEPAPPGHVQSGVRECAPTFNNNSANLREGLLLNQSTGTAPHVIVFCFSLYLTQMTPAALPSKF